MSEHTLGKFVTFGELNDIISDAVSCLLPAEHERRSVYDGLDAGCPATPLTKAAPDLLASCKASSRVFWGFGCVEGDAAGRKIDEDIRKAEPGWKGGDGEWVPILTRDAIGVVTVYPANEAALTAEMEDAK